MSLIGARGGVLGAAGVAAGGGEVPAGTVVIGSVLTNDTYSNSSSLANAAITNETALTASWAESAGTTTISRLRIRCGGWDGGNVKGLIYTSAGVLVATTNVVNFVYGDPATYDFIFASPPTITKGASYRLAYILDTNFAITISHNNNGANVSHDTSGTYLSPPSNLSLTVVGASGVLGIWAVV
jgi:hypothetical protein